MLQSWDATDPNSALYFRANIAAYDHFATLAANEPEKLMDAERFFTFAI